MQMVETLKKDLYKCISSFQSFILSIDPIMTLRESIFKGKLNDTLIRPLVWKLLLDVYPQEINITKWIETTLDNRAKYKLLMRKYLSLNPNEKESNIKQYFEDNQMKNLIDLDIKRTYQEMTIFHDITTKLIFSNILFIWSKENADISYKQGLNELLAVIFLSFYPLYFKNKQNVSKEELLKYCENKENIDLYIREIYMFLNDENEIQADLYTIFEQLMKKGGNDMFTSKIGPVSNIPLPKIHSTIDTIEMKFSSLKDFFQMSTNNKTNEIKGTGHNNINKEGKKEEELSFFTSRCSIIIQDKLKGLDKQLYDHLTENDVECRMILQRWMKCLFNREFDVESVFVLWDAIFANQQDNNEQYGFVFIDHIALAMLLKIRRELLQSDQNDCYVLLFKYPLLDTSELVRIADKVKIGINRIAKGKYVSLHDIIDDNHKKENSSGNNSDNNITKMKKVISKTGQSLGDFFKKMTDPQYFRMPSSLDPIVDQNNENNKSSIGELNNNTISSTSSNSTNISSKISSLAQSKEQLQSQFKDDKEEDEVIKLD